MITPNRFTRYLLIPGIVICALINIWVGRVMHFPESLSASILQHPSSSALLLVIALAFFGATFAGSAIAGVYRFDAGVVCACMGLTVYSLRAGTMHAVLFDATSKHIFMALAIEVALLGVMVWCAWQFQWALFRAGWLKEDSERDGVIASEDEIDQKIMALCAEVVIMVLLMLFMGQSDAKRQVLAAVGISAIISSMAAYAVAPTQPSIWYWAGPFIVGALGYLANYLSPAGWEIGDPRGPLANLARPLPIDYASVGVAGAIAGYWLSRRWQRDREDAEEEAEAAAQPTTQGNS
jgi:hypothetical protein